MRRSELIRRADMSLADLANGGLMQPEQSDRFYRKLLDTPTILQQTRGINMTKPKLEINKIGFTTRMLQAAKNSSTQNGGPFEIGDRAPTRYKPTTSKITLDTSELIAEIDLPYEVIEDNIEGGEPGASDFENLIVDYMASRAALDLEEFILDADKASGDAFLALQDGVLKRTSSNVVNNSGAPIDPDVFAAALKAVPDQYRSLLNQYKFFVAPTTEIDYRMQVAQRQTSLGDATLTGQSPVSVLGVGMESASKLNQGTILLTNPKNILWGIWRKMTMEFDRDISERFVKIVLTMRAGIQIEEEDMGVKIVNVG